MKSLTLIFWVWNGPARCTRRAVCGEADQCP